MTIPFRIDRILGDRPFAEAGDPILAVADERHGLLAVAGEMANGMGPVAVYGTDDLAARAVLRLGQPVHAMAFHPAHALLAVGTGRYDGGYFFVGELLLLDIATGAVTSLIEHEYGRQVLGLQWLDEHELRVLMAPPDDWQDENAFVEGHVAVVRRPDWRAVPPRSLTGSDLAGPRVAAPRPDGRAQARRMLSELSQDWDPRGGVRAIEELSDGRVLATLGGVRLECWLPALRGRQWAVPDDQGGREIAVAPDERSAWVNLLRPTWERQPPSVVRLSVADGAQIEQLTPSPDVVLVRCADGRPALAPAGHQRNRLHVRRGSRIYVRELEPADDEPVDDEPGLGPDQAWLTAADLDAASAADRLREPGETEFRRLFPYSWIPGEAHFAGPGVETADGSLVQAGASHPGYVLQPGESFVVRREVTGREPRWVFRTDQEATALDCDARSVYVSYRDGEIVVLDLADGSVRWRGFATVAALPVVATALTAAGPGRLLIGTSDGRVLDCSQG